MATIRVYDADEQKLFRNILERKGAEKEPFMRELIEKKLDEEGAIIQWLKRNDNYQLYSKLKGIDNEKQETDVQRGHEEREEGRQEAGQEDNGQSDEKDA